MCAAPKCAGHHVASGGPPVYMITQASSCGFSSRQFTLFGRRLTWQPPLPSFRAARCECEPLRALESGFPLVRSCGQFGSLEWSSGWVRWWMDRELVWDTRYHPYWLNAINKYVPWPGASTAHWGWHYRLWSFLLGFMNFFVPVIRAF
jgi:hypothetical protein